MFTVIITLAVIAGIFGLILGYSAIRFKVEGDVANVVILDAVLMQKPLPKVKQILTSVRPEAKRPLLHWPTCLMLK